MEIKKNEFKNLTEIYSISDHVFQIVTKNGRTFRIYAKETIRGPHRFSTSYDELVRRKFYVENEPDDTHLVWIQAHGMPWQDGDTVEKCLRAAMSFVNERGGLNE